MNRLGLRRSAAIAVASATVVAVGFANGGTSSASTAPDRSAGSALQAGTYVPGQLLVKFAAGTTPAVAAKVNATFGATTAKSFGSLVPQLRLIQLPTGLSVSNAIADYAQLPNVVYAQPNWISHLDRTTGKTKTPNDPRYGEQWGFPKIDAPTAWAMSTGSKKVVVTDIDSGMDYTHEDLAANVWQNKAECSGKKGVDDDKNGYVDDCYGIDTIDGDSDPMDENGHGTHTAGTIGAVGDNKIGVTGVNWNVKVMACRSHDASGSGSVSSIIECFQYVKMEKVEYGNDIIATNNSYGGCPEACDFNPATYDAIKALIKPGVVMAFAAGNSNRDNDLRPNYPSNYDLPNIVAVAATDSADNKAGFSQWGLRSVDVGAPGVSVLSTYPGNAYASLSGTSMATPHVAGLIGLLHAYKSSLTWWQIRNLVVSGGDEITSMDGRTVSGRRINAAGSMSCKNQKVSGLLSPVAVTGSGQQVVSALNINCDKAAGAVSVKVDGKTLKLADDGKKADLVKGDGIYAAYWTPDCKTGSVTFKLSTGQSYDTNVAACVTVKPGSGGAGDSVKVTGSGYTASEVVDVFFDSTMVATVNADSSGKLSASVKVPKNAKKGDHSFGGSGQTSGLSATTGFTVK